MLPFLATWESNSRPTDFKHPSLSFQLTALTYPGNSSSFEQREIWQKLAIWLIITLKTCLMEEMRVKSSHSNQVDHHYFF